MPETTPATVWRTWFPATVRLPGGAPVLKAKVFATDAGLMVYAQRPAGPELVFQSLILLDKTAEPGTDHTSQQRGHVIATEAGVVTVSRSGACSCGMRGLKAFAPAWAGVERKWGE